jgi:hypothetical protein
VDSIHARKGNILEDDRGKVLHASFVVEVCQSCVLARVGLDTLERGLTESLKRRIDLEVCCASIMLVKIRRYVLSMSSQLDSSQVNLSSKALRGKKMDVGRDTNI